MKKQPCTGGFPGRCENLRDPRNPHWCDECDKKRIASISKSLKDIAGDWGLPYKE